MNSGGGSTGNEGGVDFRVQTESVLNFVALKYKKSIASKETFTPETSTG